MTYDSFCRSERRGEWVEFGRGEPFQSLQALRHLTSSCPLSILDRRSWILADVLENVTDRVIIPIGIIDDVGESIGDEWRFIGVSEKTVEHLTE